MSNAKFEGALGELQKAQPSCANCLFLRGLVLPDKSIGMFCKRYPPQVVGTVANAGAPGQFVFPHNFFFPQVAQPDENWCGEWKAKN
jgi:hypothetical protein